MLTLRPCSLCQNLVDYGNTRTACILLFFIFLLDLSKCEHIIYCTKLVAWRIRQDNACLELVQTGGTDTEAYLPTSKLHFQEQKRPKSRTRHNFLEHISKHTPTFMIKFQLPDFMGKSQSNPTLCTSLIDSVRLRTSHPNQAWLSASPIISQQYCQLQSSCQCHLSRLQWPKATSHSLLF